MWLEHLREVETHQKREASVASLSLAANASSPHWLSGLRGDLEVPLTTAHYIHPLPLPLARAREHAPQNLLIPGSYCLSTPPAIPSKATSKVLGGVLTIQSSQELMPL